MMYHTMIIQMDQSLLKLQVEPLHICILMVLIEQSSNVFNNLKSGSYLIAVVDNNSQTITTTTIIHEPFPLNIKLDINDVLKQMEKMDK